MYYFSLTSHEIAKSDCRESNETKVKSVKISPIFLNVWKTNSRKEDENDESRDQVGHYLNEKYCHSFDLVTFPFLWPRLSKLLQLKTATNWRQKKYINHQLFLLWYQSTSQEFQWGYHWLALPAGNIWCKRFFHFQWRVTGDHILKYWEKDIKDIKVKHTLPIISHKI